MGKVLIRFYEELNDYLPAGRRKRDFEVPLSGNETAREIIEKLGCGRSRWTCCSSMVGPRLEKVVNEGAGSASTPVFESMNIEGVSRIRKGRFELRFIGDRDLERWPNPLRPWD
jgi:hypothetical protein